MPSNLGSHSDYLKWPCSYIFSTQKPKIPHNQTSPGKSPENRCVGDGYTSFHEAQLIQIYQHLQIHVQRLIRRCMQSMWSNIPDPGPAGPIFSVIKCNSETRSHMGRRCLEGIND